LLKTIIKEGDNFLTNNDYTNVKNEYLKAKDLISKLKYKNDKNIIKINKIILQKLTLIEKIQYKIFYKNFTSYIDRLTYLNIEKKYNKNKQKELDFLFNELKIFFNKSVYKRKKEVLSKYVEIFKILKKEKFPNTYGGNNSDQANSIIQTTYSSYAVAGWTTSYGAGSKDF